MRIKKAGYPFPICSEKGETNVRCSSIRKTQSSYASRKIKRKQALSIAPRSSSSSSSVHLNFRQRHVLCSQLRGCGYPVRGDPSLFGHRADEVQGEFRRRGCRANGFSFSDPRWRRRRSRGRRRRITPSLGIGHRSRVVARHKGRSRVKDRGSVRKMGLGGVIVGGWGLSQGRGGAEGQPLGSGEVKQARIALGIEQKVFRAKVAVGHPSSVNALI